MPPRWVTLLLFLLITPGLGSCTTIGPVVKIGLLAPFEGVERRNGYTALAALRQALTADRTAAKGEPAVAIIPLALHIGSTPTAARRATQKMLADPTVKAIIGPYDPALAEAIRPLVVSAGLPWFLPYAVDPAQGMGATAPSSTTWSSALVDAVAVVAKAQGQQQLRLMGDPTGWPTAALTQLDAALPIQLTPGRPAVEQIAATDAVLWLGNVTAAVSYIDVLRQSQPAVPFWLGPWGADPILPERTANRRQLYWIGWLDDHYDGWAAEMRTVGAPTTPLAYLTFRATEAALATIRATPRSPATWHTQVYVIDAQGVSQPLTTVVP